LRWLTIGYLGGIATSVYVTRRVKRAVDRFTPPQVRVRVADGARDLRDDVTAAVREGRIAMREREDELREAWSVPPPVPHHAPTTAPVTPGRAAGA
jgi:hypothetical protein